MQGPQLPQHSQLAPSLWDLRDKKKNLYFLLFVAFLLSHLASGKHSRKNEVLKTKHPQWPPGKAVYCTYLSLARKPHLISLSEGLSNCLSVKGRYGIEALVLSNSKSCSSFPCINILGLSHISTRNYSLQNAFLSLLIHMSPSHHSSLQGYFSPLISHNLSFISTEAALTVLASLLT